MPQAGFKPTIPVFERSETVRALDSATTGTGFELGLPMKLVSLIKMCLDEIYIEVRIGKYLLDVFPIQNGLYNNMQLWRPRKIRRY